MRGKRIITAVTMASMLIGMAGCGSKPTSGDNTTTVTVWSCNTHSKTVCESLVKKWNETTGKEKGVKIDYQVKDSSSYNNALELALQNNDAPELFDDLSSLKKHVENNYLLALDDIAGCEEIIKKTKNKLIDKIHILDGKTYRAPISASPQGLIYNKDMFKAAGIVDENGEAKPPETYEEMRKDAKLLTNDSARKYGIILPMKWAGWFAGDIDSATLSSAGFIGYNPVSGEYDYSAYVPIMEAYVGMKNDGSVFPDAESLDNDPARAQFAAGNIGMKIGFSFDVGVLNDQFPAECDWGVAPYPVVDKNNKYLQRMDYGSGFSVAANAKEKVDESKLSAVINFFYSDEYIIECYKQGISMPLNWDLVKDVELENPKKGWKEFTQLSDISSRQPNAPSADYGVEETLEQRFINDVWTGNKTAKEVCDTFEKVAYDAREKYYSVHTELTPDEYLIPDWNIKR